MFHVQTSSVEIERVCDRADESVMETAAISVSPIIGGPEQLVILVVLKKGHDAAPDELKRKFTRAIHASLNPLFKVQCLLSTRKFNAPYSSDFS